MDVRIAALDPGEDPDSVDRQKLDGLLERPRPAILWFVDRMVAKGALRSVEAKMKALDALVPLLRHVRRDTAREYYADLASSYDGTIDLGFIEAYGSQHRRWVEREPYGVVSAISAEEGTLALTVLLASNLCLTTTKRPSPGLRLKR